MYPDEVQAKESFLILDMNKQLYQVARIPTNVQSNHWAWSIHHTLFYGTERQVHHFCAELTDSEYEETPEGFHLPHYYDYREVESERGELVEVQMYLD